MVTIQILGDRRILLFLVSLCATLGGWILSLGADWHNIWTPASIGGLFVLLANNVFANAVKNIGLFGAGSTTATSTPESPTGGSK